MFDTGGNPLFINFLVCKYTSGRSKSFGIVDAPPPSTSPAYIDINKGNERLKWILEISNPHRVETIFYALDNCILIKKKDNPTKQEKCCDGLLSINNKLTFVELKSRKLSSNWRSDGIEQLVSTIHSFQRHYNQHSGNTQQCFLRTHIEAIIANKKAKNTSSKETIKKFADKTNGLILCVQNKINLDTEGNIASKNDNK